jgi:hypothetical protein
LKNGLTVTDGFLIVQDHRLQCRQCELEGTLFVNSSLRGTDLHQRAIAGRRKIREHVRALRALARQEQV